MPEAPSIKEALEIVENLIRRDPACFNLSDELLPVRSTLRALATLQPDGERREAIARIIDPTFVSDFEEIIECKGAEDERDERWQRWLAGDRWQRNLAKADAILASGLVQNEAGIRRDEREKCARIAERFGEPYALNTNTGAMMFRAQVSKIAAAIRSARNGGAET